MRSWCVDLEDLEYMSRQDVQDLLDLAVDCGAVAHTALSGTNSPNKYRRLFDADYSYVGVDILGNTLLSDFDEKYGTRITLQQAKEYLERLRLEQGTKASKVTLDVTGLCEDQQRTLDIIVGCLRGGDLMWNGCQASEDSYLRTAVDSINKADPLCYSIMSVEDIKQKRIKELEEELYKLKSDHTK